MTILFVSHYSGFYGANKSLLSLICFLRDRHRVEPIVLLPCEGRMCHELEQKGIPYTVSHYYWWVNYNHGVFQWLLNKRKQVDNRIRVRKLCALFRDIKIDLVYTNSICVNIGYLIAKRKGVPHIWHLRESLAHFKLSIPHLCAFRIWESDVNRRYILVSDYMMDFYKSYLPASRMAKVYNGVDLPEDVCRKGKNELKGRLQIACIGVLCDQKNQLELLRAQSLLLNEGVEVETWLIGAIKTEYLTSIQNYIQEKGMSDLAHIVGHTDDVFEIMQNMNLGVVTARDEAFGRVTVEYMLMRMPVVASRSGANAELMEDGVAGDLYDLGDVMALANAIRRYVEQPELLEEQGFRAERKAKVEFSAERNADLIYEQIIDVLAD